MAVTYSTHKTDQLKKYKHHRSKLRLLQISLVSGIIIIVLIAVSLYLYPKIKRRLEAPPTYNISEVNPSDIVQVNASPSVVSGKITVKSPGEQALLPGAKWVPQTFNNCGPASTSMILQYFGFTVDQNTTKAALRTSPDDKNVFTYEIRDYLKSQYNIEGKLMYNGTTERLKTLLTNGFYVLIEDWLHPNEGIGHFSIIKGYDDSKGVFIADDSYLGINITYKYDVFYNEQWQAFNHEYMPIYKSEKEDLLKAIVSSDWDEKNMFQKAVSDNLKLTQQDPGNVYHWFNLGTSFYNLDDYQHAKQAFEKAQSIGWPKWMLWYQIQPVQTYNKLSEYQKAIDLANQGLAGNDSFSELHLEKALAYKGLGNIDQARSEIQKALQYYPNFKAALELQNSL